MPRILRGLSSRVLPCGCLIGRYETYEGKVVDMLDAQSPDCSAPAHQMGHVLDTAEADVQTSTGKAEG